MKENILSSEEKQNILFYLEDTRESLIEDFYSFQEADDVEKIEETIYSLEKDQDFIKLFHVTPHHNLESIAKKGLTIDDNNEGISLDKKNKIFFWDSIKKAEKFKKEIFEKSGINADILEVVIPKNIVKKSKNSIYKNEFFTEENISKFLIFQEEFPLFEIFNKGYFVKQEIKKIDFSKVPENSKVVMFTGETGCGKTYNCIKEVKDSFIIAVPTRQLAYEIFLDYPEDIKYIDTGEIHTKRNIKKNNRVVVFENLDNDLIKQYSSLIIDECHFLNDYDRGGELTQNVIYALSQKKKVVFATATDSLSDDIKKKLHIEEKKLKPFAKISKEECSSIEDFKQKVKDKPILVFTKYIPDENTLDYYCDLLNIPYEKAALMSADTPSSQRVKSQIDFKNGDIQLMIATNVLAQGVNFPAVGVIIEYNEWDDWEIVEQKIGRAGRPNLSNEAFYFLQSIKPRSYKKEFNKEIVNYIAYFYRGIYIRHLNLKQHEIPEDLYEYSGYKYSYKLLEFLCKNGHANKEEQKAYNFLKNEKNRLKEILLKKNEIDFNFSIEAKINNKKITPKG